jgi:hypothetical protein
VSAVVAGKLTLDSTPCVLPKVWRITILLSFF